MWDAARELIVMTGMTLVVAWWATAAMLVVGAASRGWWSITLIAAFIAVLGAWGNSLEPMGWPIHWIHVERRFLAAFVAGAAGLGIATLWERLRPPQPEPQSPVEYPGPEWDDPPEPEDGWSLGAEEAEANAAAAAEEAAGEPQGRS